MANFEVKDGLGYVVNHLQTELPQEEAVKQIKISAHKHGFLYRSRKLKNGTVKLTIKRKEDM